MSKILLCIILLAAYTQAQFTKVFEKSSTTSPYVYAYDAEHLNDIYSSYVVYQSGTTISIVNLNTLTIEYTADISPITTATSSASSSSVSFYKNLLQSDGKWTALVYSLSSGSYNVGLFSDGKYTTTSITTSSSMGYPSLRPAGGKIYLVAPTGTTIEIYLVRNNVPTTSAIWDHSKYMAALENLKNKVNNNSHYNAIGQEIPEIQYQELKKFIRPTYFKK